MSKVRDWTNTEVAILILVASFGFVAANALFQLIEIGPNDDKFELQLDSGSFTPNKGFQIASIIGKKTITETDNFFFLQTTHYLDLDERKKLEEQGITLVDFFNHFVYVASANDTSLNAFPVNSHPEIRSMIPIEPDTKLDSNIKSRDVPPWVFKVNGSDSTGINDKVGVTIFFHKQLSEDQMMSIIKEHGSLELTTDSDGISDSIDQCPTQDETVNGFDDLDGCPDVVAPKDTDNDGIDDKLDECPIQAEIVNGFQDSDGCPDVAPLPTDSDSDGDLILDSLDSCPKEFETVNGFQDSDGCPDVVPPTDSDENPGDVDNSNMRLMKEGNKVTVHTESIKAVAIEGISAVSALMSFDQITELSKHSAIKFIRYQDPPLEPEISEAKRVGNINQIKSEYNLTGKGSVALIFDGAFVSSHRDFNGRLYRIISNNTYMSNDPDRGHSTLVAGILGGDGSVNSNYKGVAPKVQILSWGTSYTVAIPELWGDDNGDLVEAFEKANSILNTQQRSNNTSSNNTPTKIGDRIDVMNISLGHEFQYDNKTSCRQLGNYTTTSHILDRFVNGYHAINNTQKYSEIIITKSAGNQRIYLDNLKIYQCGEFSTVNSPATAKNPIVVGSIDSDFVLGKKYVISSFSSFGPTDDGRIKPDLVAPGAHNSNPMEDITSTGPNNDYIHMHGTSMAAPLVGGLVVLMEEKWEQKNKNSFEPHLLPHTAKAILIHTADDLGNPGPDYKYGWGLVNGKNAIKLIEDSKLVKTSTSTNTTIKFPIIINDSFSASNSEKKYSLNLDNPTDLKLTLVWDDRGSPPGDFKSEVLLENNLDLLISKGTDKKMPLVLDKNIPDALAKEGTDTINNVEMIKSKLDKGVWTITVKGTGPFLKETGFTLIVSKK